MISPDSGITRMTSPKTTRPTDPESPATARCTVCGATFVPRTARQVVCGLTCFLQCEEQRELHRSYLQDKSR